jgi:DNA polymerase-3 subunit delta'
MAFESVIGQARVCRLLEAYLTHGEIPSLLFAGRPGVGKRTVAFELARAANCLGPEPHPCGKCNPCRTISRLRNPDIKLVFPIGPLGRRGKSEDADAGGDEDDASTAVSATLDRYPEFELGQAQPVPDTKHRIRIELIRWLRTEMSRPPHSARRRFFIILHADRMTDEAANALLKILEEPQEKTTFILTTDSPNQLPETVRSRCRTARFADISPKAIAEYLCRKMHVDQSKAELAAAVAEGSIARAVRFIERPDELLLQPVVKYFASSSGSSNRVILSTLQQLARQPQWMVTGTLLFLFRETLRVKLGLGSAYGRSNPAIADRAARSDLDYLRRAVRYLLTRDRDSALYTNPKLSLYSLLAAVRQPDTSPAHPARKPRQ